MRIVYAGLPAGAVSLRARGHEIVAALVAGRDRSGVGRLRRTLGMAGAPVFVDPDLADEEVRHLVASPKADALVSFFWPRRIPPEALALFEVRLGAHPSLLPRHRGADPIFWTILKGDVTTGVSIHDLAPEMDGGDVRLQIERPVGPDATGGSLWRDLRRVALDAMAEVLQAYDRGAPPPGLRQDGSLATEAPTPTDDDLEIRWRAPADEILRLVRAASPDPGAFTEVAGRTLTILSAAPTKRRLDPGDAVLLPEGVCIGTGTEAIVLVAVGSGGATAKGPAVAGLFPVLSDFRSSERE